MEAEYRYFVSFVYPGILGPNYKNTVISRTKPITGMGEIRDIQRYIESNIIIGNVIILYYQLLNNPEESNDKAQNQTG